MTRKLALESLRVALIEGDQAKAMRIYVENRISRTVFNRYLMKFYREAES